MKQLAPTLPPATDLKPLDDRLDVLEGADYAQRTLDAAYWADYTIRVERHTWTRLQKDGVDQPGLTIPKLPPPRPGRHWQAQIEGFLRLGVTKRGTVYVGIQIGSMGGVSGGKLFTEAGDDLVPIMQRLPVDGGETIYFSIYTTAEDGDSLTIIPNPNPYLLIREVAW